TREEDEGLRTALLGRAGATQPTLTPHESEREQAETETKNGSDDKSGERDGDNKISVDVTKTEQTIELAQKPPASAPAPSRPAPTAEVAMESVTTVARARHHFSFGASAPAAPEPTEQIGLLPPPGWSAPTWDPNLPAALAGGWDLSYPALAPETIAS